MTADRHPSENYQAHRVQPGRRCQDRSSRWQFAPLELDEREANEVGMDLPPGCCLTATMATVQPGLHPSLLEIPPPPSEDARTRLERWEQM